ncbi:reverse transcriptase [Gossypium australe]|uniref:Reverse transcriptase n=1 Tax=Gossypium australe TaxID=47621 RepID=A0A5B6VI74_9ROSI|nr:reverse transcriptase [Gossypium australe]
MDVIREALDYCVLTNLGYQGRWYTWERENFRTTNIRERLDRGVENLRWYNFFSNCKLLHLDNSIFDHCPIFLDTVYSEGNRSAIKDWGFRFERMWLLEESCEDEVQSILNALYNAPPDDENSEEIIEAKLDLNLEIDKTELYWEKRARSNWLKYGDRNTSFFP